jgi:hypothetical protein
MTCQMQVIAAICVMHLEHGPDEIKLLALLKEVQATLAAAADSLNDSAPPPTTVDSQYLQFAAHFVSRAVDGYAVLREAYRVDASKLFVRPVLEIIFAAVAIMKNKGILTRKAISECEDEIKMVSDPIAKATARQDLEAFKKRFSFSNPSYPVDWTPIRIVELAAEAGMETVYNTTYRTYCKFTHGALAAIAGDFNEVTDLKDTQILITCVMMMLDLLKEHTPAQLPELTSLRTRLSMPM